MKRNLIFLVLLLGVPACTRDQWQRFPGPDDAISKVPWFATMKKGLSIKPLEMPRNPVPGTVPITGAEAPLPITPDNLPAINRLRNPVPQTAASIERGKDRFEIYCSVCHGFEGRGDGLVAPAMANIIPSIITPKARAYTDGYIYSLIRHGRGIMPAYGERIRGDDRWNVVNYVRVLQGVAR